MALHINVTRGAPLAQAFLHGSLDRDSARVLRLKAQSLLATGHRFVVLDLAQVTEIDGAGQEALRYVRHIYGLAGAVVSVVGADLDVAEAELERALTGEVADQERAADTQRDRASSSAPGSIGLAT